MNHILASKRNRYNDGWTTENERFYVVIPELRNRYFGVAIADKGRAVYQGPILENLAVIFGRATVINNHGGTGADIARQGHIEIKLGDTITFCNRIFRVEDEGDHYNAKLVEVQYADCHDCGATYDPRKGSCGCRDRRWPVSRGSRGNPAECARRRTGMGPKSHSIKEKTNAI